MVSAVRLDEREEPENPAEAAIAEEMAGRTAQETTPHTPPHADSDLAEDEG